MASVCFIILVAIFVGQVFAQTRRNCSYVEGITNCDECFRCGGTWCMASETSPKCRIEYTDSWCAAPLIASLMNDFVATNKQEKSFNLQDIKDYEKPEISFVNSTIKGFTNFDSGMMRVWLDSDEKKKLYAWASTDFCPANGQVEEHVTVQIRDAKWEKAKMLKLAIPCACSCSSNAVEKSEECSRRGTYSCNACACEKGWKGPKCETRDYDECGDINDGRVIDDERGDIGSCDNSEGVSCSNNGKCENGKCRCNLTLEGSQYFDDTCLDICRSVHYHDTCLLNPPVRGLCKDLDVDIMIDVLNRTRLAERDRCNRKIWVNCTEPTNDCTIRYMAMKDHNRMTHVMILEPCNALPYAEAATLKVTVPVILGVLAVVATAAAVAGYMVWKNRAPPLPLNNPGYSNIDAEDCTGMNPLYKPPTSSFKNPTYGKW